MRHFSPSAHLRYSSIAMSKEEVEDTWSEIQDSDDSGDVIPLVLIHDGGGTVFNYWTLGPLHRPLFGISDPAFESGADWKGWEGGLVQMAEVYCATLNKHIGKGSILLGGKCFFTSSLAAAFAHTLVISRLVAGRPDCSRNVSHISRDRGHCSPRSSLG
jgi:hypothetical protein